MRLEFARLERALPNSVPRPLVSVVTVCILRVVRYGRSLVVVGAILVMMRIVKQWTLRQVRLVVVRVVVELLDLVVVLVGSHRCGHLMVCLAQVLLELLVVDGSGCRSSCSHRGRTRRHGVVVVCGRGDLARVGHRGRGGRRQWSLLDGLVVKKLSRVRLQVVVVVSGRTGRDGRRAGRCGPNGLLLEMVVGRGETASEAALVQHAQVVDGHLEDLGLLQLGGALLLEGGRHEAAQLAKRVVDLIAASLLDHAAALLARGQLGRVAGGRGGGWQLM